MRRFDFHESLARADSILSAPPARVYITRPNLLDRRVFRAALPSEICLTENKLATARMQRNTWILAKLKDQIWSLLEVQSSQWMSLRWSWPFVPIDGVRPQVIATKFSERSPDVGSNPAKAAIDMLQRATQPDQKHRMGIIHSDAPKWVEQVHHWEYCPREFPAFVVVEVRV